MTSLLDTAKYLNSVLMIGSQTDLTNKIALNQNNLNVQKSKLQDIQDDITTQNRYLIEQESQVARMPGKNMYTTLQDWSLYIFCIGFAVFSLSILIYIFVHSSFPLLLSISYLLLNIVLYTFFVFLIQRYG